MYLHPIIYLHEINNNMYCKKYFVLLANKYFTGKLIYSNNEPKIVK